MTEPSELGGYRLCERIAVGGMAEIYRAVRQGPGQFAKTVAIKRVLPDLGQDPEFVEMFVGEARLAARLASPNLVQVFDFGEQQGFHYLVMEHVDGLDLAALLARRGPLPVDVAIHVARQLCAALGDLHQARDEDGQPQEIVHRDVTPGNVLLSVSGEVKLGDFGIAKDHAQAVRTARGAIKGKLAYLSPEQARGEPLDQRADLYGLGLVLFEALTGERYLAAAKGADPQLDLLRRAAAPERRSPSSSRADLPPALDAVVRRALEPEPARRFASAELLDQALREVAGDGDAADLRRALGALVREVREPARPPDDPVVDDGAPASAAGHAPASRPKKGTEVLAPRAGGRLGHPVRRLLVLGALVALVATAWLVLREPDERLARAPRPAAHPPIDATLIDATLIDATPIDTTPIDAGLVTHPAAVDARRRPHRRARRAPPDAPPRPGAADAAARPADATVPRPTSDLPLRRLSAIGRLLARRGILPADAPALFAEQRALATICRRGLGGAAVEPRLSRLRQRAERLAIDRPFIDAKLQRIDRALRRARLGDERSAALQQRARRALSFAVTGRFREANVELNSIAHAIAR